MKAARLLRLVFGFSRLHPEAFLFSLLAFPPLYGFFTGGENATLGPTRMASLFTPHYALLFLFRRAADLQKSREFFRLVVGPGRWTTPALVYLLAPHALGRGEMLLLRGFGPFCGRLAWTGFFGPPNCW